MRRKRQLGETYRGHEEAEEADEISYPDETSKGGHLYGQVPEPVWVRRDG